MGSNSGLKNRINYSIFIMLSNVATHKKCNENAPYILIPFSFSKDYLVRRPGILMCIYL